MNHQGPAAFSFPVRATLLLLSALAVTISSTAAQTPGITDNGILIGSCSALDGPARFLGSQTVLGAIT